MLSQLFLNLVFVWVLVRQYKNNLLSKQLLVSENLKCLYS